MTAEDSLQVNSTAYIASSKDTLCLVYSAEQQSVNTHTLPHCQDVLENYGICVRGVELGDINLAEC